MNERPSVTERAPSLISPSSPLGDAQLLSRQLNRVSILFPVVTAPAGIDLFLSIDLLAMHDDALFDAINKIPFLTPFPDRQKRELAAIAQIADFDANAPIIAEWKLAQHLYLIIDGSVELTSQRAANRRIGHLSRGDLFGWSAMIEPERYLTASAVAVTPTQVLILERQALLALMERHHELGYRLMSHLASVLAERLYHVFVQLNAPVEINR